MKTATIINNHFSKKNLTYISIGIIAVLAVVGVGLGFFIFQNPSRANEESPQNVSIEPGGNSAKVSWTTPQETIAVIEYGTAADPASFTSFAFSETPTTTHSVDMSTLKPNTTYYFHIRIGETVFDNGGTPWSFTTSASIVPSPSVTLDSATASPSATIIPTPTSIVASISAVLSPTAYPATPSASPGASPTVISSSCPYTSCALIQSTLGTRCNTQDYIKCILKSSSSTTPTTTIAPTTVSSTSATTPSPTGTSTVLSASTRIGCGIDYFQSSSCKSFTWTDVKTKSTTCTDNYTKYFVQCKSNSFTSNDASTWYCNETQATNSLTVPCGTAPTPAPGQSVFCRVRAETETGGATNATAWMYASSSCSQVSSTDSACAITYLQGNNCKSWLWDRVNNTNQNCKAGFDHYTLQCTSNGDYTGSTGTWYCDNASTNHYLDLPCFTAPTPADGATVQCRVRAEDSYGGDSHSTAWVSSSAVCPTSTPTPTPTATPTPTSTPTNTPTPTP